MTVYVDSDALKASLALSGTTFADDDVDAAAIAASGALECELARDFGKTSPEARLYPSTYPDIVVTDDLVSVTSVETDSAGDGTYEEWEADEYRLEPLNAATKDEPYEWIHAKTRRFPRGRLSVVRVTGVFGWPAVPQQIIEAATIVATQLVQRKRTMPMGFVINGDTAAYLARSDPQVTLLLRGLSRRKPLRSVSLG